MKNLGLVTYKESPKLTESDQLLVEPLQKDGFEASAVAWDDTRIDWSTFDCVIIRSCWNYHHHILEFFAWLTKLEQLHVNVWNPIPTLRWNANKKYLKDLKKNGVHIVPTIVLEKGTNISLSSVAAENHWTDVVIKPAVGASAYGVFKVTERNMDSSQKRLNDLLEKTDILIQPLMGEIADGEYSFMFLGGQFSHAVLKIPKIGEFRSNYDLGGREIGIKPDKKLIQQASSILKKINTPLLYARVDGINRNGIFMLMELELIEPHLFFNSDSQSPVRFARALKKLATI